MVQDTFHFTLAPPPTHYIHFHAEQEQTGPRLPKTAASGENYLPVTGATHLAFSHQIWCS